jgi:hypothetical protein
MATNRKLKEVGLRLGFSEKQMESEAMAMLLASAIKLCIDGAVDYIEKSPGYSAKGISDYITLFALR